MRQVLVVSVLTLLVLGSASLAKATKIAPPPLPDPPSACTAVAGNLVANCGFETGSFSGWTTTPAASGSDFGVNAEWAHSGTYGAGFGATGTLDDSISQTLTTAPGTVNLSFWLANFSNCVGCADFSAHWDGVDIFDALSTAFSYTPFSFIVPSTGSDTLQFFGRQVPSFYGLDDVVVTQAAASAVPEPSTFTLLGTGLMSLGFWRRRRLIA